MAIKVIGNIQHNPATAARTTNAGNTGVVLSSAECIFDNYFVANNDSAEVWVKFYNKATAATSADTPFWTLSRTVATGSCSHVCAVRINANTTGIYWVDGAALKGQLVDNGGNIIEATFTVVASGVDTAGISGFMRTLAASQTQIVLEYISSGSIIELYSTDGKTFT